MSGSRMCVYTHIYVCIYVHTSVCVFTSNKLCQKQMVLQTSCRGTGEWWGVFSKPLHASGALLHSPQNCCSQAEQRVKRKAALWPHRNFQFASCCLWAFCATSTAGMCSGISSIFWIHLGTAKEKKITVDVSAQPNRLVCTFLNTDLVFKVGGKHSAEFSLLLCYFLAISTSHKSANNMYFFHFPWNGTFRERQENF